MTATVLTPAQLYTVIARTDPLRVEYFLASGFSLREAAEAIQRQDAEAFRARVEAREARVAGVYGAPKAGGLSIHATARV